MKPRITLWIISLIAVLGVSAQNRIDRFVDSKSTMGRGKFTSVIERDPKSREIVRVIKVRELTSSMDIAACYDIFEDEKDTGHFSHTTEGTARHTLLLAIEGEHQDRIYMLQYTGSQPMRSRDGKVTIVIKMKK